MHEKGDMRLRDKASKQTGGSSRVWNTEDGFSVCYIGCLQSSSQFLYQSFILLVCSRKELKLTHLLVFVDLLLQFSFAKHLFYQKHLLIPVEGML